MSSLVALQNCGIFEKKVIRCNRLRFEDSVLENILLVLKGTSHSVLFRACQVDVITGI